METLLKQPVWGLSCLLERSWLKTVDHCFHRRHNRRSINYKINILVHFSYPRSSLRQGYIFFNYSSDGLVLPTRRTTIPG